MKESKNSYSHILKYTGLFGSVEFLSILIGLVRNKCVAVLLGPQGMGLISLFNSTITLVSSTTNLGIPTSAVRDISEAYESGDSKRLHSLISVIRSWSLLTGIVGMLLCVAISPLLSRFTFSYGEHTFHFVCLSPIIALMAITGGETAILKGTRHLKRLATISIYNVIGALLTSVPIYYYFGNRGIVPSMFVIALLQMILIIALSYSLFPLNFSFGKQNLSKGISMVRLGIAFVLAGILGSGADFVIRSYFNYNASEEILGLYNAGYMMTMVYAGMVFSAMETDFFPRLSAVNNDLAERNATVNRQIEVSVLLISPLLVLFSIGMPIILPLLYSYKFLPAVEMMQITVLAMYVRAVKLPVAYISLSRGDSKTYLSIEALYGVLIVLMTVWGVNLYGLEGAGAALALAGFIEYAVLLIVTRQRYGYRVSRKAMYCFMVQFPIGIAAFVAAMACNGVIYWITGILLFVSSLAFSVLILRRKVSLWNGIKARFCRNN